MLDLNQLRLLREKIQEGFQELSNSYHGNNSGVLMTSHELSERDIRAGLDTRTEIRDLYVTKKGWDVFNYTEETNTYGSPGAHITCSSHRDVDDEQLLELFIKGFLSTKELEQLVNKYIIVVKGER